MTIRSLLSLLVCSFMLGLLQPLTAEVDAPDFSKMRVKELQAILDERGVVCNGCAEKADLVKMAKESYHLPLKRAEPEPKTASADTGSEKAYTDADLEELMKKLNLGAKGSGKGFKVFKADDLKKLSDEDMQKKFQDEL